MTNIKKITIITQNHQATKKMQVTVILDMFKKRNIPKVTMPLERPTNSTLLLLTFKFQ